MKHSLSPAAFTSALGSQALFLLLLCSQLPVLSESVLCAQCFTCSPHLITVSGGRHTTIPLLQIRKLTLRKV